MARRRRRGADRPGAALTRLLLAIGFLTRLPVPRVTASAEDFAGAIRWYPVAGVLVGVVIAVTGWVAGAVVGHGDAWVVAAAALVAWVVVTGALHLDGLCDLADGLGAAHRDPARLLKVMADPHVGSFGVVTVVLQLLAKLVLLHALAAQGGWWAVIAVPFAARIGPLAWARWLPLLQPGIGAAVKGAARARDVAGWTAVLAGVTVAVPGLLASPLLILGWGVWLRRRIGGITGDGHGAGIELVETALLAVLVATRG